MLQIRSQPQKLFYLLTCFSKKKKERKKERKKHVLPLRFIYAQAK